ncbi:sorting nexin-2 isoform X1 [Pelobates cultripes]|uniref:Sorting nexin-2 isoform X1 n=1 Tax=Pelobates cultripes TaxID=61616 RepID=A0AAD1WB69_PELCU|nr:sorting nexin-2 isoform X1 [Pelobates cultripes]
MAAEREPPPLGDGRHTDFEELDDGEDLFTSTVSTMEPLSVTIQPGLGPAQSIPSMYLPGQKKTEIIQSEPTEHPFYKKTENRKQKLYSHSLQSIPSIQKTESDPLHSHSLQSIPSMYLPRQKVTPCTVIQSQPTEHPFYVPT